MAINRLVPPPAQQSQVRDLIADMPFWKSIPLAEVLDLVAHETRPQQFADGEQITAQEGECRFVYYVFSGQVRLERWRAGPAISPATHKGVAGPQVQVMEKVVDPGYLVGRFALTYNLPYTSTATAVGEVTTLVFPTSAFERLIYRYPSLRSLLTPQAIINRLRTMPLLTGVGLVSLSYLAEEAKVIEVEKGGTVYTHERAAERLYLINKGQVELIHPRQADQRRRLGTGNAFGFPGSIGSGGGSGAGGSGYGHWARATTPTALISLPWPRINQLARRYPHIAKFTIQDKCLEVISRISVFDGLKPEQKRNLAGYCTFQHIPQHHLITYQGDIGDSMWVLLDGGRAILTATEAGNTLPPVPVDGLIYFGEQALIALRNVHSTIEAEPGGLWLRFHWQDFQLFLADERDPSIRGKLKIRLPDDHAAKGTQEQYSWLSQGEQLFSLTRRHWLSLLLKLRVGLLGWLVTLLAIAGLYLTGISIGWALWLVGLPASLAVIWGILDHTNDFFIVTNQRIIQQEKVILTSEMRREALLEQVIDVKHSTSFWGNFFNYGVVSVYTAGAKDPINFDFVPDPSALRSTISDKMAERKGRYRAEGRLEIQNALEKRLGLVIVLPSRVISDNNEEPIQAARPWYKRLWRKIFPRSQPHRIMERMVWRKHWFVLARQAVPLATLTFGLGLVMLAVLAFDLYPEIHQLIVGLEFLLLLVLLGLIAGVAWVIADWANDTYELTNDRIIDIEKLPLFLSEERREARLGDIQDIRLKISSPLEMILNYGDVIVQTAAKEGSFTFVHVPNPRGVKDEINRRVAEYRREEERMRIRAQMADLPDWFEMYRRLEAGIEPTRVVLDNDTPKNVKGLS